MGIEKGIVNDEQTICGFFEESFEFSEGLKETGVRLLFIFLI